MRDRVLVLFNKADGEAFIAETMALLSSLDVDLVSSVDDFHARAEELGGWREWCSDVVEGSEYGTFRQRFDAFICTHVAVGSATAEIVRAAVNLGKPVAYLDTVDEPRLRGVIGARTHDLVDPTGSMVLLGD